MITEQRTKNVKVEDSVKSAIAWLEKEYPRGVDLVYVHEGHGNKGSVALEGHDLEVSRCWCEEGGKN